MSCKKLGRQTVELHNPPSILSTASIVGPKEGEGPLGRYFDEIIEDELWGEKTWEKAESKMVKEALAKILSKAGKCSGDVDYMIGGDLLNQSIAATFGLRASEIPYFGVYGACSTMAESMSIGAMFVDGGFADHVICITSSHFCSAERQFRFPLELGSQRPPTAQWTVTASGGVMLAASGNGPFITHVTTGKIVDMGIKDANNMGAAMAPAAADTIVAHFKDTGRTPEDYDMIITGDLGAVGRNICHQLVKDGGYDIGSRYDDCGVMIYDLSKQDSHSGGSGCGCSASVFSGFLHQQLTTGTTGSILFAATGALLSPTSTGQGETIPSIAHGLAIQRQ